MLKKKENGFVLLPVALILVVLVVGAGVLVLKKGSQKDAAGTNQATTQKDQNFASNETVPVAKSEKPLSATNAGFTFDQNTAWGAFTFTEDLSTYNENGKALAQSVLLGQYYAYSKDNGNLRVEIFSAAKPWPYIQNTVNGLYRYNPSAASWQKQKLDQLTAEKADTADIKNMSVNGLQFFKIVTVSDGSKTITYQSKINDTYMVQVVMNSCVHDTKTREGYTKDPGLCEAPNATTYFTNLETLADAFVGSIKKL
jgi:cytoskeletal protein RodZ